MNKHKVGISIVTAIINIIAGLIFLNVPNAARYIGFIFFVTAIINFISAYKYHKALPTNHKVTKE